MFSSLPYEIMYNLYDYLQYRDIQNLFKSFDKELYSKGLQYGKKYVLRKRLFPLEIIDSKLFFAKKIKLTEHYELEELEMLNKQDSKFAVYFSDIFDKNINLDKYSSNIYKVVFGDKFNKKIISVPDGIKKMYFGSNYNKQFNFHNCELTHIKFGSAFDQSVDELPKNLEYLIFSHFNQNVNKLPNKIKFVRFGPSFSKSLNDLPDSVEHLSIDSCFSRDIIMKKIPDNLKILDIKSDLVFLLNNAQIKKKIDTLIISDTYNAQNTDNIMSLFDYDTIIIKASIYYELNCDVLSPFAKRIEILNNNVSIDDLPDSIEHISLDKSFTSIINKLPKNLKTITFSSNYKGLFLRSKLDFKNIQVKFY